MDPDDFEVKMSLNLCCMDPNNFRVKIHEISAVGAPSLSFDDFERILPPWRQQSNTGNGKNEHVLCIFASRPTARVLDHCNTGLRIFVSIL